ncbi:MAG: Tar ligand binding domain-containing protein, partial [Paucibacter sp.]|nr:Tar ligand binding domain-containing protein [Roseateles sp.]
MVNNLKVATRLSLLVAVMTLAMLLVGLFGLRGMDYSNAKLKTVYEDRTVCLGQLSEIESLTLRNRVLIGRMLIEPDAEGHRAKNAELDKNLERILALWKDYTSTYLTPDEQKLADEYAKAREDYLREAMVPVRMALATGDTNAATQIF